MTLLSYQFARHATPSVLCRLVLLGCFRASATDLQISILLTHKSGFEHFNRKTTFLNISPNDAFGGDVCDRESLV